MTSKASLCQLRLPFIGRSAEDLLIKVPLFRPSSLGSELESAEPHKLLKGTGLPKAA